MIPAGRTPALGVQPWRAVRGDLQPLLRLGAFGLRIAARPAASATVTTAIRAPRVTSLHVFCAVLLLAIMARPLFTQAASAPAVCTAATVFVAVCVQALPFLVFGVLLSGVIAAFVSPAVLRRALPSNPAAAVPVAGRGVGAAGM